MPAIPIFPRPAVATGLRAGHQAGFTLLEIIVGMVLLAAVLGPLSALLLHQGQQGTDPVQQVRAAQLAQRIAASILARDYDEQSDHNGSLWRCGETVNGITYASCTAQASYGPDSGESVPALFNDVDDFDTTAICLQQLTTCTGSSWVPASYMTQLDSGELDIYRRFLVSVAVTPISGCASSCAVRKQIVLQVQLPDQSTLAFTFERGNY